MRARGQERQEWVCEREGEIALVFLEATIAQEMIRDNHRGTGAKTGKRTPAAVCLPSKICNEFSRCLEGKESRAADRRKVKLVHYQDHGSSIGFLLKTKNKKTKNKVFLKQISAFGDVNIK